MSDLKDYREKELKNYVIGNVLLILYFTGKIQEMILWDNSNDFDVWGSIIESVLLSSIIYIYVFILDSLISGEFKFKICYFGSGKQPGYTIFSDMQKEVTDDRFSKEEVLEKYKKIYDEMPETDSGKYQNVQWFNLYNECKNESKIYTSNRDYLLCRDLNIITIWLLIIYLIVVFAIKAVEFSSGFLFVLFAEFVLTNIAMRTKGKRLAYNVISVDIKKDKSVKEKVATNDD